MSGNAEKTTVLALLVMIVSLWVWHAPWLGLLLSLPLLVCVPWMLARRVRAFILAGALALPYLCYAIVEIVVATGHPPGAIVLLAAGVVFMALLSPATRRLTR